ncbi:hypothetical protein AB0F11_18480 [Streptomyces sp. NPDC032472]|uniref:hypothetical protein n=1 Tax=Streptomyces sp. NPDC032472 TaxID=3155018 RepID=UPI0033D08C28
MPEPQEQPPGPEPEDAPADDAPPKDAPPKDAPRQDAPPKGKQPPAPPKSAFLEKAAYIAAPGTIVIGVLYYFGSTYTESYYSAFGVPTADLRFSIQAYLVNSPSAVFFPLWLLLVCGLVVLLALGWAGRALAVPERAGLRRKVTGWVLGVGLLVVLLGFPAYFWEERLPGLPNGWIRQFVPCLVVALGATLAFFGVQLHVTEGRAEQNRQARAGDRLWLGGGALLLGMLTMSLFFGMARYASVAGATAADDMAAAGYVTAPRVVIHSRVRIPHHVAHIKYRDLGQDSAPYRYEYLGFRLLAMSPSRLYLVSYAPTRRSLVVLPDDDTVRLEISP